MKHAQKTTATLLLASLFVGEASFAAEYGTRVVKEHETLSGIAFSDLEGSIYHKKNGNLRKLMALNPWIKDGDEIKPGQVLVMPRNYTQAKATKSPAREVASVKESVEEAVSAAAEAAGEKSSAPAAQECRAPASETPEDGFTPLSHLGFSLGTEYFRIDGTDKATRGTATILSRMSPAVRAFWRLDWSEEWSSILAFRFRSDRVSASDNGNKRIEEADGKSWGFSASVERRWGKNGRTRANLGRQEYLFARAPTAQTITLDRVGTTFAGLEHEQTLVRVKSASAGIGAAANALLPSDGPGYKIETGWNGRGFAFVQHERESFSIRGDLFLEKQTQNSSLAEQKTTTTGMALGLIWKLQ
ncbi:MAG: LysM domain-containing protein [Proteobacteria bacterium]|nr:MAG: LysM domain-containing protein [Pseudomonadota bacterium]